MAEVISIEPKRKIMKAMEIVKLVGEVIRDVREIPSGHLYACLMEKISFDDYTKVIDLLKKAGLVEESNAHMLSWKEPR